MCLPKRNASVGGEVGGLTMREILFRGKRVDNGEWISGDLRHWRNGMVGIHNNALNFTLVVVPETVGQFTGLRDKNGRRIFEGDILHLWIEYDNEFDPIKKYRAIVEFGNPNAEYNWGFQLNMLEITPFNNDILLWIEMEESGAFCEVIGNIHDNPELLEVSGDE